MKINETLSVLENRMARILGYSTTARVVTRFIRNVAIVAGSFYLFVGSIWFLVHLVPDDIAHGERFRRLLEAGVGAAGIAMIFGVLFGVLWVFANTYSFRKHLKSGGSTDEMHESGPSRPSHINVSDKAEWTTNNDELVEAILKSNTHPQIGINVINKLFAKRININARNENGRTALSIANYYEASPTVRSLLVNAGAKE